ncbi:MAG: tRNA pseudouridine(55) synthase TruB [Acidimicrobiia bacterium]|nr:tRNA pseudouridine(55) synthase TruB [Acidimicrobiia bacterium]
MARRRRGADGPDGVAVVDKPAGWTSHDVVARARRQLGTSRVGHAGTLDPAVTGVLVLGVGRATRLLRFLTALGKAYVGEFQLGVATDTLDAEGEVVARHDMSAVTIAQVEVAAAALTGAVQQIPPMVSAVQVDGRRLHDLAREGVEVERPVRTVQVDRFDVSPVDHTVGRWHLDVVCGTGTYVRTLVDDLGRALDGSAHLVTLRRTRVGSFTDAEAVPLDELDVSSLLSPAEAVRDMPAVRVTEDVAADVRHGRVLPVDRIGPAGDSADAEAWAVLDEAGTTLLAVYEPHRSGTAKPAVVLTPAAT